MANNADNKLQTSRTVLIATTAVIACAGGASLWYIRVSPFELRARIHTTSVALSLGASTSQISFSEPMNISSFESVGQTAVQVAAASRPDAQPVKLAGSAEIDDIEVEPLQRLVITTLNTGCTSFVAYDGQSKPGKIEVNLHSDSGVQLEQGTSRALVSGQVSAQAGGVTLCLKGPIHIQINGLDGLDTDAEIAAGITGSSLLAATVEFPDADRTLTLPEDEGLHISTVGSVTRLSLCGAGHGGCSLGIEVQGRAKDVLTGVPGLLQPQTPRLLWFLQAKDELGGLLAIIGVVWSVLWAVVNIYRPGEGK